MRAYNKDGTYSEVGDIMTPNSNLIRVGNFNHFTEKVTLFHNPRKPGQYRFGTAIAEMVGLCLTMSFSNLKDGQELYTLIRTGKILPSESYDNEQISKPAESVLSLLRQAWDLITIRIRQKLYQEI